MSLLARAKPACLGNVCVRIIWLPVKTQTNRRSSVNSRVWAENLDVLWKKLWELFQEKKKKGEREWWGKDAAFLHLQGLENGWHSARVVRTMWVSSDVCLLVYFVCFLAPQAKQPPPLSLGAYCIMSLPWAPTIQPAFFPFLIPASYSLQ